MLKKDENSKTELLTENTVNQLMDELKATKIAKTAGTSEVRLYNIEKYLYFSHR